MTRSSSNEPIAIIGIGCLFPKAKDRAAFWSNIVDGVDAIRDVPESHWKIDDYLDRDPKAPDRVYTARGGFLDPIDFDALEYGVSPNNVEATDTSQLLGLVATQQALIDAGYGPGGKSFDRKRTSVLLGVTGTLELVVPLGARLGHPIWRRALRDAGVDSATAEDVVVRISESYVGWQENSFPGLLGNVVAGRIANKFDFGGTNCVVDAACASSLGAIHLAALELASGRSDLVVTGGVDTFNDIFMYMCFSKTPALSPSGDARPFDSQADGTILGEGLGIVVLKRLADAERDGDRVYALLRGMGTSSDGKGNAVYAPTAKGQIEALRSAYEAAGVTPDTIELVEAHGTGTKVGDAVEVSALTEVFSSTGRVGPWCALGSIKSQIGHTKAAAGAAGLIKAALALYHKVLPPTIKVRHPSEAIAAKETPFYVNSQARPWLPSEGHPRRAAVSAFGFGGSNFHCLLEEHTPEKKTTDWPADVRIAAFSADSQTDLLRQLSEYPAAASWEESRLQASRTRRNFRVEQEYRLVAVVEKGRGELAAALAEARAMLSREPERTSWETPSGVYFARGKTLGKLAALFPGQGSQYVGMLRDWACSFPQMQAVLAEADAVYAEATGESSERLTARIYPPPTFSEAAAAQQESDLQATQVAQPAIGAVSLGALAVLENLGVRPAVVAGHSYGELTALCAARCFDAQALHRLSRLRGRLMADQGDDVGGMLAVNASASEIERVLSEEKLSLTIANRNAPKQAVLSGANRDIERATATLDKRSIRNQRLRVSAAFHSPLVSKARGPFAAALGEVAFTKGRVPVFANSTAKEYPADPVAARSLLAGQLAEPVEFIDQINNMYEAGVRTFVEVGPAGKLSGLVRAILADKEFCAVAVDASAGKRSGLGDLARALAKLASVGESVQLADWDPIEEPAALVSPKKAGVVIPLCGANYVKPKPRRPAIVKPVVEDRRTIAVPHLQGRADGATAAPPAKVSTTPKHEPVVCNPPPIAIERRPVQPPPSHAVVQADLTGLLQQGLLALQKTQEQASLLHKQFLENQLEATRTIQALLEGRSVHTTPRPFSSPRVNAAAPQPNAISSFRAVEPPAPQVQTEAAIVLTPVIEMPSPVAAPETVGVSQPATTVVSPGVGEALLAVVSEKTGYPQEMLQMEMGLDADLGIDSIKRVEILAALQERLPDAPRIGAEHLGDFRTLADIAKFLGAAPAAAAVEATPAKSSVNSAETVRVVLEVVAEKTGYPTEMLQLEMGLDADLGIDSIKRVEILSALQERLKNAPQIGSEHLGTMRTLGDIVNFLCGGVAVETKGTSPPAASPVGESSHASSIAVELLAVVAEKTGYPSDMLQLEMSLDADLGIDSIKRVEILSAVQERLPTAPRIGSEQLGTMKTLADVAEFLAGGVLVSGVSAVPVAQPAATISSPTTVVAAGLAGVDAYVLRLAELDLAAPRATIPLALRSIVWITDDGSELATELAGRLESLEFEPRRFSLGEMAVADVPEKLAGLILIDSAVNVASDVCFEAFRVLQRTAAALKKSSERAAAIFATVSRLDGGFGLHDSCGVGGDVAGGGLAGLVKTAAAEWPTVHCKALDVAADAVELDQVATALCDELMTVGPAEVGLVGKRRFALELTPYTVDSGVRRLPLGRGDVAIVTGGARGVTAETAVALARAAQPTVVLFGRRPAPHAEALWLRDVIGEAEIKRAIVARSDGSLTPKQLSDQASDVTTNREALTTIARVEAAGSACAYFSVDVRDAAATTAAVADVRRRFGPIRALVHGAGVLADRLIEEKSADGFRAVYDTKVRGAEALLGALTPADDLRCLVFFSSSTARFGRKGQVDYAAANEVLNKIAQRERRNRPACRVLSLNWGPWDGGMVTPALKSLFAQEHVTVIPLAAGAQFMVDALSEAPGGDVEIVILGKGSQAPTISRAASTKPAASSPSGANVGWTLSFERSLDVMSHPILRSHVLDGRAVMPAALMIEWFVHAAMHRNPGLVFHGLEEFRVLKGIVLQAGEIRPLRVFAGKAVRQDSAFRIPVELRSNAEAGKELIHARTEVLLGATSASAPPARASSILHDRFEPPTDIYNGVLFHGPELQGITKVAAIGETGIDAVLRSSPPPSAWMEHPLRSNWFADPLIVDAAFQALIVWSRTVRGAASLPVFVKSYRQYCSRFPAAVRLFARVGKANAHQALADVEFVDSDGVLLARIEGYECVIDRSLDDAFTRNKLI